MSLMLKKEAIALANALNADPVDDWTYKAVNYGNVLAYKVEAHDENLDFVGYLGETITQGAIKEKVGS